MTIDEAIKIISQMIKDEEGFLSDNTVEAHKMAIKALEQEPKTAHWVEVMEGNAYRYKCTNCDELVVIAYGFAYCPHCGAKMAESEE